MKANQRESGRWFTRSLVNDDNKHYLAHIGSAFAVMAIRDWEDGSEKAKRRAELREILRKLEATEGKTEKVKKIC